MIEKGATLHCVAISQYCFKIGRLTVPPPIVVGISGFGVSKESPVTMERWGRAKRLRQNGQMRRFLKEGWKGSPSAPAAAAAPVVKATGANGQANGQVSVNGLAVGKELQKKERKGWSDVPLEEQWWRLEPELENRNEQKVQTLRGVRVGFGSWAA